MRPEEIQNKLNNQKVINHEEMLRKHNEDTHKNAHIQYAPNPTKIKIGEHVEILHPRFLDVSNVKNLDICRGHSTCVQNVA